MPRICVTEWSSYYNSPEESFRSRFNDYKRLGVDTLRVETGWLQHPALINALKQTPFNLKMIVYVLGISPEYGSKHPAERMVDEHGVSDWHLGPWNPEFEETTRRTAEIELKQLVASGLKERVREVVVDLGPAGEGIYPANWTVNDRKGEEAFWCYSVGAQASFREAMQRKYRDIDSANGAWGLTADHRFASWKDLAIPQPRTDWARGPFWNDMLTWYRDSKRTMFLNRIAQTQRLIRDYLLPDTKCIVYLPGYAYSSEDWDLAVREASGPASIRLMMDNDWLMTTAVSKGCTLQYTGVENAGEVRNMVRKLKAMKSTAYQGMWGENAGYEPTGRNPGWLADVITSYRLRGIDYTWSNWLFEKDGVTHSPTFDRFASAVQEIRTIYSTGKRLSTLPRNEAAREVAPGQWELACEASTRLMSSFPDEIKGGDPEIAAVDGGQVQRMLLKFPMELLPTDVRIVSARLVMRRYLGYAEDTTSVKLGVYRVLKSWSGTVASWKEAGAGVAWEHPGGDVDGLGAAAANSGVGSTPWASVLVPPFEKAGDTVSWDVSNLVRRLVVGPDYGLMIATVQSAPANKSFASAAHPDPAMRPILQVEVEK